MPDGGAFDGPLGIVSAFAALDQLDRAGLAPGRPVGIACFADEEGARFGVACAGSRLLTGALDPDRARSLTDDDGTTMAEAMAAAGHDPAALGRDDEALRRVGTFLELHVEQGRALRRGARSGVASSIWPHGRWRLDLRGRADHAGHDAAGRPGRPDARPGRRDPGGAGRGRAARRASPPSARCGSSRTASTPSRRR